MPRFPTYQEGAGPAMAPGARLNATVRPVSAADGVRAVGQVMAEESRHALNQVRQTQLEELATKRQEMANRLALDPESGYQRRSGKDAFGVPQEYGEAWQKGIETLESEIRDDAVRDAFKLQTERDRVAFDRGIMQHVGRERQVWDDEVFQEGLRVGQDTVAASYNDPLALEVARQKQIQRIEQYAERNGKSEEWRKNAVSRAQSSAYRTAIDRHLADGNDIKAKEVFTQFAADLTPDDAVAVQKSLEIGSTRGEAHRATDDLLDRGLNTADGLAEIRKRYADNPTLRDAVQNRFLQMTGLRERAKDEQTQELGRSIHSTIIDPANPNGLDAVPPSQLADLRERSPDTYAAMLKIEDARIKGKPIVTDDATFYELQIMAADEATRGDFTRVNLLQYADKLSPSDRQELMKLQAGVIREMTKPGTDAETTALLSSYRTTSEVVNDSLHAVGIDPSMSAKNKDRGRVAAFRKEIDRRVLAEQQATGKKLGQERIQQISEALLVKQVIKTPRGLNAVDFLPFGFLQSDTTTTEVFAFENPAVRMMATRADEVPRAAAVDVADELRMMGHSNPTDQQIIARYNERLLSMEQ